MKSYPISDRRPSIWLPPGSTLVLNWLNEENKEEQKIFEVLSNFKEVSGQIGTSYVIREKPRKGPPPNARITCFVKIPDPVPPEKYRLLRDRIIKEAGRGKQLNELIAFLKNAPYDTGDERLLGPARVRSKSAPPKRPHVTFKIPEFITSGIIVDIQLPKTVSASSMRVPESEAEPFPSTEQIATLRNQPFVAYQNVDGERLDARKDDATAPRVRIAAHWFSFAEALVNIVRRLHNFGFLHASILPRNILVQSAGSGRQRNKDGASPLTCWLAGFGYSSLAIDEADRARSVDPYEVSFHAPEFYQRPSLDALWHSADLFSIGAVLLYVATGNRDLALYKLESDRPPRFLFQKPAELKRHVRSLLKSESAAGPAPGPTEISGNIENIAKLIDNCLRFSPKDRIATTEELLTAIHVVDGSMLPASSAADFFERLKTTFEQEQVELASQLTLRHHFEGVGSRSRIIENLCRLLGSLPAGARYRTITLPSYWTSENLGPNGRFLAMNKHASTAAGITIQRIFLVPGDRSKLSDVENDILTHQLEALRDVRRFHGGEGNKLEVMVWVCSQEVINMFERSGKAVAFVEYEPKRPDERSMNDGYLCMNFISHGSQVNRYGKTFIERKIEKVRIWNPGRKVAGDSETPAVPTLYWKRFCEEYLEFEQRWDGDPLCRSLETYWDHDDKGRSLEELLALGD